MNHDNLFESYKVFEVLVGSSNPERKGLALRKLKRLLAPQSQENPIYFHMTNGSSVAFRKTVDQLAEVGFEMVFYSFGSGFNLEADDITTLKADIAYANSKGNKYLLLLLKVRTYKIHTKTETRKLSEFGLNSPDIS